MWCGCVEQLLLFHFTSLTFAIFVICLSEWVRCCPNRGCRLTVGYLYFGTHHTCSGFSSEYLNTASAEPCRNCQKSIRNKSNSFVSWLRCGVTIERVPNNKASILSKVSCSLPAYMTPKCHLSSKHSRCTHMCTWYSGYIWVDTDLAHFSQCEPIILFKVNANGQWYISAMSEYVLNTKWIRDTACVWFTVVARIRRHFNTSICVSIGANSGHSYGIRQRLLPVITLTVHLMATMYFSIVVDDITGRWHVSMKMWSEKCNAILVGREREIRNQS